MTAFNLFLWFFIFLIAAIVAIGVGINAGYFDPDEDGIHTYEVVTLAIAFVALWFFCVWTWEAGKGLIAVLP